MKRIVLFILVLVALLLPSTVFARIGLVPVTGIKFNDLGVTTTEQLPSGGIDVTTIGLGGEGFVDCDGDPDCIATGFDGQTVEIREDLQLLLSDDPDDPFGLVTGRARGEVVLHLPSGEFRTLEFTETSLSIDAGNIDDVTVFLKIRMSAKLNEDTGTRRAKLKSVLNGVMANTSTVESPIYGWTMVNGDIVTIGVKIP